MPTKNHTTFTLLTLAAAGLVLALLSACGNSGAASGSPPKPATTLAQITIIGNPLGNPDSLYKPATLHIHVGQTVVWTNHDDSLHTVTPDLNYTGWPSGSGLLHTGQRYSFRFTRPGVYRYSCMVHPNMFGTVIVHRK
jgi:plastocyanin